MHHSLLIFGWESLIMPMSTTIFPLCIGVFQALSSLSHHNYTLFYLVLQACKRKISVFHTSFSAFLRQNPFVIRVV